MQIETQLEILFPVFGGTMELPYISDLSGGQGDEAESADLNDLLVRSPASTFYGRVSGCSSHESLSRGDLLVIDRNKQLKDKVLVVCLLRGEYTVRRMRLAGKQCWLEVCDEDPEPVEVTYENEFVVWGVVTHTIRAIA